MPTTAIYSTLFSRIETILSGVSSIKEVFSRPTAKISSWPAAVFYPMDFENDFETNAENYKIYKFVLYIVVSAGQKQKSKLFNPILANTVDDILEAFVDISFVLVLTVVVSDVTSVSIADMSDSAVVILVPRVDMLVALDAMSPVFVFTVVVSDVISP